MIENVKEIPVNVLSFKHPETGLDYFTFECDVVFRNLINKAEDTILPQKFAEGVLEKEIGQVTVNINRDIKVDSVKEKEMEADVRMVSKKDSGIYIFEMQTSAPNGITKRFSAYASSVYKNEIKKGMLYADMPPVILVVIMTKNIPKLKNVKRYHSVWNGREEIFKDEVFEENITIHIIELPKYIEHKKKTNEVNIWLEFIIDPLGKEVREAMRTKEELRLAVDMLNLLNSDEQVREIAFREILDDVDRNSEIRDGEERGEKRGLKQGLQQGQRNLIKKMIENGTTIEQIAEMLKVDVSEVEKLLVVN